MSELQEVRVFISWSKPRSRAMAEAVRDWLPNVLQRAKPWMSDEIDAGAKWATEIGVRLESYHVGICCVTPENQTEPWLLYEAGALSKAGQSRVCPLLFPGMEPASVPPPLGLLNAKRADHRGVLDLVTTINSLLGAGAVVPQENLRLAVEMWWPKLSDRLASIPAIDHTPPRRVDEKIDEILTLVRGLGVGAEERFKREYMRRGDRLLAARRTAAEEGLAKEREKLVYWVAKVKLDAGGEFSVWTSGGHRPVFTAAKFPHPDTQQAVVGRVVGEWRRANDVPDGAISAWELS